MKPDMTTQLPLWVMDLLLTGHPSNAHLTPRILQDSDLMREAIELWAFLQEPLPDAPRPPKPDLSFLSSVGTHDYE